jgi:DNA-binding response OmpR family regulator
MPKKILVVDDEMDWVQVLVARLQSEGYEVNAAFDGLKAMMQMNKWKPDLVLLDIMMPAGGGLNVLRNARENIKLFSIPVIVLTAKSDEGTRKSAEELKVSGYFVKPVDMDKLKERIKELLGE